MVLLLDGVADVDELAVFEDKEVVLVGEGLEAGDGLFAEVGEDVDVGFDDGDVGAEACELYSSVDVVLPKLIQEDVRSARSNSSLVVVTSADTVTLDFLASATWNSFFASALGWLLARVLYGNCDLDDMLDGGVMRG